MLELNDKNFALQKKLDFKKTELNNILKKEKSILDWKDLQNIEKWKNLILKTNEEVFKKMYQGYIDEVVNRESILINKLKIEIKKLEKELIELTAEQLGTTEYINFITHKRFNTFNKKELETIRDTENIKRINNNIKEKYLIQATENINEIENNIKKQITFNNKSNDFKNAQKYTSINNQKVSNEKLESENKRWDKIYLQDKLSSIGTQIEEEIDRNDSIIIFKTITLIPETFTNKLLNKNKIFETLKEQNKILNSFNTKFYKNLNIKYIKTKELTKAINIHEHIIEIVPKREMKKYFELQIKYHNEFLNVGRIEIKTSENNMIFLKNIMKENEIKTKYDNKSDRYTLLDTYKKDGNKKSTYIIFDKREITSTRHLINYLTKYITKGNSNLLYSNIKEENQITKEELYFKEEMGIEPLILSSNFFNRKYNEESFKRQVRSIDRKYKLYSLNNFYNQKRGYEEFLKQDNIIFIERIRRVEYKEIEETNIEVDIAGKTEAEIKHLKEVALLNSMIANNTKTEEAEVKHRYIINLNWNNINWENDIFFSSIEDIDKEDMKLIYNEVIRTKSKTLKLDRLYFKESLLNAEELNEDEKPILESGVLTREHFIKSNMSEFNPKPTSFYFPLINLLDNQDIKRNTFYNKIYYINKIKSNPNTKSLLNSVYEKKDGDNNKIEIFSFNTMVERNKAFIKDIYKLSNIDEIIFYGRSATRTKENALLLEHIINQRDIKHTNTFKNNIDNDFLTSLNENDELIDIENEDKSKINLNNKKEIKNMLHKSREELLEQTNIKRNKILNLISISDKITRENIFTSNDKQLNNETEERVEIFLTNGNMINETAIKDIQNEDERNIITIQSALIASYYDNHNYLNARGINYYANNIINEETILKYTKHFNVIDGNFFIKDIIDKLNSISKELKERMKIVDSSIYTHKTINIDYENMTLNEYQKKAIDTALKENIMILSGGAGSGKTTTSNFIIKALKKLNKKIEIVAPTGSASKRISDVSGESASTIHKLFKINIYGVSQLENELDIDILIIDEASMIDNFMLYQILYFTKRECKIIFIGDPNQIPPVANGFPFKKLQNLIPTVKLEQVYRQGKESLLLKFANKILDNEIILENKDYKSLDSVINEDISIFNRKSIDTKKIIKEYLELKGTKQILSDNNKDCNDINKILQNENPNEEIPFNFKNAKAKIIKWKIGDKIIQVKNNYNKNVVNGDLGYIHSFYEDKLNGENTILKAIIVFNSGIIEEYNYSELKQEVKLAYAITIHKSQGNEWENVLIFIDNNSQFNKNLLYTAITRAKTKCILISERKALKRISNTNGKLYFRKMTDKEIIKKEKLNDLTESELKNYIDKYKIYEKDLLTIDIENNNYLKI